MIGSWSNQIIDESRCHVRDRHTLDTPNSDANYVALGLVRMSFDSPEETRPFEGGTGEQRRRPHVDGREATLRTPLPPYSRRV